MKINDDIIARYLRNELSPKELSNFTVKMVMDKELKQEVEAMRMVFKTLKTTPLGALQPKARPTSHRRLWGLVLLLLVALLGIGYLFLKTDPPKPALPQTNTDQPIAANFETNEYFEQFVIASSRDVGTIKVVSPKNNFKTPKNTAITFRGELSSDSATIDLVVWNNHQEDYVQEKPVFQLVVPVNNQEFDFVLKENLPPGLYYFTLGKEAYFGKFVVEN